jgi:hypothetical protein
VAARNNGALRGLAAIAVGSAAAGFGWSAGRDLYRKGKDFAPYLVLLAAVAGGSGYAAWNLTRGHRAPSVLRVAGAVLAAVGSLALCVFLAAAAGGPSQPGRPAPDAAGLVGLALMVHTASALLGLAVGFAQRGRRRRAFAIEAHNMEFMAREGIRDVGGREETYLDGQGNELKLDDVRSDAMVFRVPGRRGARAYIDLDGQGRMTGYRPA